MTAGHAAVAVAAVLLVASAIPFWVPTATAKAVTVVVEMRGGPLQFVPDEIRVDPGDALTVFAYNNDTQGHTFTMTTAPFIVDLGTAGAPMAPATVRNATVTTSTSTVGVFWFFCAVPGHASQRGDGSWTGMAGRVVVGQPAPGPDLTVPLIIVGVIAAAGVGVGLALWARRRAPKS